MKDLLINSLINIIRKYYDYNEVKLNEIKYGLTSLYLQISKTIVIFSIAYFLGYLKTLLIFMFLYTILRTTGFGVHTKKSWQCWIISILIFNIIPFMIEKVYINEIIMYCVSAISTLNILIYAPADTEKHPLYNKNKRIRCKIITFIESIIYIILLIKFKNQLIKRCIMYSLLLESLLILPITYKIFGVNYNNFKKRRKKE